MVVAVVIHSTDLLIIDPLLGMLLGLVLVYASWGILRDSVRIPMESGTPTDVDLDAVRATLWSRRPATRRGKVSVAPERPVG
ncbi:MAG: hypothetical protein GWO39_14605, partial [Gammaproteobacteria bacterium]|nr:hypothetical protein [Gammaproteobacteria bacterium]NIT64936.1 hypothetical protein [Gammaproteobacteria bacterium]NIY33515.1 hypothetical protein [Gammaproteobacteria bacterium]